MQQRAQPSCTPYGGFCFSDGIRGSLKTVYSGRHTYTRAWVGRGKPRAWQSHTSYAVQAALAYA
ncbi:MAG: hypothetical protein ACFNZL_05790 [Neisseria sp.]